MYSFIYYKLHGVSDIDTNHKIILFIIWITNHFLYRLYHVFILYMLTIQKEKETQFSFMWSEPKKSLIVPSC